jgi:hypothetical protein
MISLLNRRCGRSSINGIFHNIIMAERHVKEGWGSPSRAAVPAGKVFAKAGSLLRKIVGAAPDFIRYGVLITKG